MDPSIRFPIGDSVWITTKTSRIVNREAPLGRSAVPSGLDENAEMEKVISSAQNVYDATQELYSTHSLLDLP